MCTATRQTLRSLWRDKAYSITAVGILALGIGATTSMFSIVNSVLLQPLAYDDPDRLFAIYARAPDVEETYPRLFANGRHYAEWRRSCSSCESITAFQFVRPNLTVDPTVGGPSIAVNALRVSEDFLRTIAVQPILGRGFTSEDHKPGANQVALLTTGLWSARFQGDANVLGRTLNLNGQPTTVIGILPESFRFDTGSVYSALSRSSVGRPQIVLPSGLAYETMEPAGSHIYGAFVRLRPGVTAEAAMAEMDGLTLELSRKNGFGAFAKLLPLKESIVGESRHGLWLLLGGVALLLLIACVNLGNLMLVRAERRMHGLAVRQALGARRHHLVIDALRESLVVSLVGGAFGLLAAYWAIHVLVAAAPIEIPRLDEIRLDRFSLIAAIMTSVFAGVAAGKDDYDFSRFDGSGESNGGLWLGHKSGQHGIRDGDR